MIERDTNRASANVSDSPLRVPLFDLLQARSTSSNQRGKRPGTGYGTPQNPKSDRVLAGTLQPQESKQLNSNTLENFKKSNVNELPRIFE